jgi:chloramphenicol-sensitive protein RarD
MSAPVNNPDLQSVLDLAAKERRKGILCAASAYVAWGVIPLYFHLVRSVPSGEIIAHRILWCVVILVAYQVASGAWRGLGALLRQPRSMALLALSSTCIATNWLIFIYAVHSGQVLQTSLGYYINPLFSVALGTLLLKERLRPLQLAAVGVALLAVSLMMVRFGEFPWISLSLACTFGLYGLIRKHVPVSSPNGLLAETSLMLPLAVGYLAWLGWREADAFSDLSWSMRGYLTLAGPVTTIPLLLFASGARRLPLSTLGFLQYLAPSISFLVAVFLLGEPFGRAQAVTFPMIWCALALYSADTLRHARRRNPA